MEHRCLQHEKTLEARMKHLCNNSDFYVVIVTSSSIFINVYDVWCNIDAWLMLLMTALTELSWRYRKSLQVSRNNLARKRLINFTDFPLKNIEQSRNLWWESFKNCAFVALTAWFVHFLIQKQCIILQDLFRNFQGSCQISLTVYPVW